MQNKSVVSNQSATSNQPTSSNLITSNQVSIAGEIISEYQYSHEVFGEKFYTVNILVQRLSGTPDIIPALISERLEDITLDRTGFFVSVAGQFRSYNQSVGGYNRLILSVLVREIEFVDELPDSKNSNMITLDGFICKVPTYRKTPLGREISDIILAVNRPYGKSDYIPCICCGRNAKFVSGLEVGTHISLAGRIQSREYQKRINETESEGRITYEVSVSRIEVVEDAEE